MRKIIFLSFLIFALPLISFAHQPRIVDGQGTVEIKNPDVSQIFYGELNGASRSFSFSLVEKQEIYLGILVPDLPGAKKDIWVQIDSPSDKSFYYFLDGSQHEWKPFYEEFAGDYYYKGPEAKLVLEKGEYNLKVFGFSGEGKYALVVGEKEEFSLSEVVKTILILPKIKKDFFEKSVLTAFFNKIGLYFLLPFVIIFLLVALLFILIIVYFRRKKARTPWVLK